MFVSAVEAGPEPRALGALDQLRQQLGDDRAVDDHAAGGRAALTGLTERGRDDRLRGQVEVGVRQYDARVLAAHLGLQTDVAAGQVAVQLQPDRGAAGEGHRGQSRVAEQRGRRSARPAR